MFGVIAGIFMTVIGGMGRMRNAMPPPLPPPEAKAREAREAPQGVSPSVSPSSIFAVGSFPIIVVFIVCIVTFVFFTFYRDCSAKNRFIGKLESGMSEANAKAQVDYENILMQRVRMND